MSEGLCVRMCVNVCPGCPEVSLPDMLDKLLLLCRNVDVVLPSQTQTEEQTVQFVKHQAEQNKRNTVRFYLVKQCSVSAQEKNRGCK